MKKCIVPIYLLTLAFTVSACGDPGGNQNQAPVADAGADQNVAEGDSVTLDGSASKDPDGDEITHSWAQTAGPSVTLGGPQAVKPTFTAPVVTAMTTLTFRLVVNDGQLDSQPDTVNVVVTRGNQNQAPVADAGADQNVTEGDSVTLDGSASNDPDGDEITHSWAQTAGPSVTLGDPQAVKPAFTAPEVTATTTLTFSLVVNDGQLDSQPDTVDVVITYGTGECGDCLTSIGLWADMASSLDAVVVDDRAYVSKKVGVLAIMDVSDPVNPTLLGSVPANTGEFGDLHSAAVIDGDLAYIGFASKLVVADVSDPASPVILHSIDLDGEFFTRSLCLQNGHLWIGREVAGSQGSLNAYSIDAHHHLTLVYSNDTLVVSDLACTDTHLFVADCSLFSGALVVLNTEDVENPVEDSRIDFVDGIPAFAVSVMNSDMIMVSTNYDIRIFDISNPESLAQLWLNDDLGFDIVWDIERLGNDTFVLAGGAGGVLVLDTNQPQAVECLGWISTESPSFGIATNGNTLFVAEGLRGIEVLSAQNCF